MASPGAAAALAFALGAASCSDPESTRLSATVAAVMASMSSDPANERIEGTFTLALTAQDEGDGAEVGSFSVAFTHGDGLPLAGVTLETDTSFPVLLKPGTGARVSYRFGADSPLPPPPNLSGWCRDPTFLQGSGTLGGTADAAIYGALNVSMPPFVVQRATPPEEAGDVGALWAAHLPDGRSKVVQGMAVDAAGNTLLGLADFGGEALPPLVTKLDPTGGVLWTRALGDAGAILSTSVAAGGDVEVISGAFFGEINLGDGLMPGGDFSTYVARLNLDGETLWSGYLDNDFGVEPRGVEVDASGNVLVAGLVYGERVEIRVGPQIEGIDRDPAVPPGEPFGFLAAFGPTGDYLFGRSLPAHPEVIAFDASGAVIVAGSFHGVIDFGGGTLVSNGISSVWVAKLDAAGQHVWSRSYNAPGRVTALELGPAGEIHLAAAVTTTADFGGGSVPVAGSQGLVVVKLDPEGGHLWSKLLAEPSFGSAVELAVDDAGRVFLGGSADGPVQLGGEELPNEGGQIALFAAVLAPSGEEVRSGLFGCSNGFVPALAFRPGVSESVAFAATFSRFASLGGVVVTTASLDDVIVAGLGP